ncbi:hypothetical protein [Pseudomonas sp. DC3000-4b1]|uniref:hypothetical protein n=1 Tax=unclassified Pseudomonas TaxID=196821 RepID=UPI003CF55B23
MTDQRFNQNFSKRPLLRVEADALFPETFRYAEERFRSARHLLASLEGADDCDIRRISQAAHLLLEDGCRVMDVIEERLDEVVQPVG